MEQDDIIGLTWSGKKRDDLFVIWHRVGVSSSGIRSTWMDEEWHVGSRVSPTASQDRRLCDEARLQLWLQKILPTVVVQSFYYEPHRFM